jgi:hypothetical protein
LVSCFSSPSGPVNDTPCSRARATSSSASFCSAVGSGQKIALGRIHARQIVTVHVAADTITIDLGEDTRTVRRTTTQPVRSIKAQQHRKAAHVS